MFDLHETLYTPHRRAFLRHSLSGIGSLALAQLLHAEQPGPLSPKQPHHRPRAKNVICLFQHGGPSQMDLFEHKPVLNRWHGREYEGDLEIHFHKKAGKCLASPFRFQKHGQAGMELSELIPHTASIANDITLIRSMTTDSVDHERALRIMHTGHDNGGRPAWGAWVLYGLGTEREDLPAYVVLTDPAGMPIDGPKNWSAGFLPAIYQGTTFGARGEPVANLDPRQGLIASGRENELEFLHALNRQHQEIYPENSELAARIANYELAARMQASVPEVLDLSGEPEHVKQLYGIGNPKTSDYARRCLIARRLVERGVRFVQLYLSGQPWDTHEQNSKQHIELTARIDQPSAALVKDLKQRGLLDETIVIWCGEFGRLPISQDKDGRDHNRHGFSLWIAGGGFKRGYVHGETDEFGYKAVKDVVRVSDLHATLLHALGLDHMRLTYPHEGRSDSLTDSVITKAKVIPALIA